LENDFLSGALTKAGMLSAKRWSTATTPCRLRARPSWSGLGLRWTSRRRSRSS